ncbi:hypothetical protein RXV86_01925 [Alisedimentitalea sp. MJ-SS2]|uniref:hypothetical protein n=1 Tax=Aliisedimentitalea sp. MJ-SS2 TaxID=3049795 RepID=UPI00290CD0DF|nr:hypothetical protein [Alisedimentitalea sp. MJ-SS2]MDU8926134.1 hypothetical protein [Alisedimentitalea sp. MJ-SS2]
MRIFSFVLAATLAISFIGSPVDAGFKRIKKYESFKIIIGKRLYDNHGNWIRLHSNGNLSGHHKVHGKVTGTWALNHGSVCRIMKIGGATDKDCQWVSLDGQKVRFVRNKGIGKAHILYWKKTAPKKTTKKKTTKKKSTTQKQPSIANELKF